MRPARDQRDATTTRRALLSGVGAASAGALAGCLGSGGSNASLDPPVRGDPDAGVTVMAFEDFACPHCRNYSLNVVPQLVSEYIEPGAIRYEFHDFPIPVAEPGSWQAANAARSVQDRAGDGAFWTFEQAVFENQRSLSPGLYQQLANAQDLDGNAVRQDAVNEAFNGTVKADRQLGRDKGVRGTPTVFVNDQQVTPTFESIGAAIQQARG